MLDFANDAKQLAEMLNENDCTQASIVSEMMIQIYDCCFSSGIRGEGIPGWAFQCMLILTVP